MRGRTNTIETQSLTGITPGMAAYLRDVSRYPVLSRNEELAVARRAREGDESAREQLVVSNLRFVLSYAKRYAGLGLPYEDLVNAGNIGLVKASKRFESERGLKFITYAVWWIRQSILTALSEHGRIVRLPANRVNALQRVSKAMVIVEQDLGRKPTAREIAKHLDMSEEDVVTTLELDTSYLSLDDSGDDDNRSAIESLDDPSIEPPDETIFEEQRRYGVMRALDTLNEREQVIMRLYFGLDGSEPMTLEKIGEELGLTRERIRQLREAAIEKLRHKSRAKYFEE